MGNDGARTDNGIIANRDSIQHLDGGAKPALFAYFDAVGPRPLLGDGSLDIPGIMIAADEITVGRHEGIGPQRDPAAGKHFAVKPDVHPFAQDDIAVFTAQDGIAANENAGFDAYALIICLLYTSPSPRD